MRAAIHGPLRALKSLLSAPIQTECELIGLLVNVRKLIEGMDSRYRVLKLFCDWPLHPQLDHRTVWPILREFDALAGEFDRTGGVSQRTLDLVNPLTSFRVLRFDLLRILAEHGLNAREVVDLPSWGRLLKVYVAAISGAPLIDNKTRSGLRHLDSVVVSGIEKPYPLAAGGGDIFVFEVEWTIRGAGVDFSIHNEFWLSKMPLRVPVPIMSLTNEGGVVERLAPESRTFRG